MTTTASQAAALEKIQKLMALAADPSCSGAEAENAARMATKMMVKYGIDEAMLNASQGKSSIRIGRASARHMCSPSSTGKAMNFCGYVAIGVGEFTNTVVEMVDRITVHTGTYDTVYRFSGEITDVKLAVWLCETLLAQAQREWRAAVSDDPKVAWLNGWGAAVQTRLKRMAEVREQTEAEMKASDSNALVVLDAKTALVKERFGETAARPSKAKSSADGYIAGMNTNIPTNAVTDQSGKNKQLTA